MGGQSSRENAAGHRSDNQIKYHDPHPPVQPQKRTAFDNGTGAPGAASFLGVGSASPRPSVPNGAPGTKRLRTDGLLNAFGVNVAATPSTPSAITQDNEHRVYARNFIPPKTPRPNAAPSVDIPPEIAKDFDEKFQAQFQTIAGTIFQFFGDKHRKEDMEFDITDQVFVARFKNWKTGVLFSLWTQVYHQVLNSGNNYLRGITYEMAHTNMPEHSGMCCQQDDAVVFTMAQDIFAKRPFKTPKINTPDHNETTAVAQAYQHVLNTVQADDLPLVTYLLAVVYKNQTGDIPSVTIIASDDHYQVQFFRLKTDITLSTYLAYATCGPSVPMDGAGVAFTNEGHRFVFFHVKKHFTAVVNTNLISTRGTKPSRPKRFLSIKNEEDSD